MKRKLFLVLFLVCLTLAFAAFGAQAPQTSNCTPEDTQVATGVGGEASPSVDTDVDRILLDLSGGPSVAALSFSSECINGAPCSSSAQCDGNFCTPTGHCKCPCIDAKPCQTKAECGVGGRCLGNFCYCL